MTSYLVDATLLVALVVTSVFAALMYRRLRRLDVALGDYRRIFCETEDALAAARTAVEALNADGRATALDLAVRIDQAEALVATIDARTRASALDTPR
ncbi:hypothetical protein [Amorphus sp. 3PC139-8]|uniref:hypothetical protein n=1 Tax=Amorphus sp. 3PC139-8 TaxID=2735676 RepID=UPI00345D2B95